MLFFTVVFFSDDSGSLRGQAGQAARVYPRSARALLRAGLYGEPTRPPAAPAAPAGVRGQLPRIHMSLRASPSRHYDVDWNRSRPPMYPLSGLPTTPSPTLSGRVDPLASPSPRRRSYRGMADVSLLLSTKKSVSVLRMSPIPFSPSRLPPPTPIVARPTMCVSHPGIPNTHRRWQRCPTRGATSRS